MATYRIDLDLLEETKNTYANAEEIINTDIEIAKTVVNSVGNDIYLGEDADTFQNDFTGYINEDMTDTLGNVRAVKTILANGLDDGRTCKKLCHDFLNVLGGSSEKSKEEMVGMLFCEQAVIASMQVACKEAVTYAENIRIGANAIDNILDELRMVSMDSTTYTNSIRNGCDKVDKLENFSSALTTYASAVESMDDYLKIGLDNCSPAILPTASQSKGTEITPAPTIIEIEMPVLASDENRQTDAEILQKQKEIKQLEQKIATETVAWALSIWAAPGYIMTEAEKKQARKLFGNGMYPGIDRESITEEDAINLAYAYSKSNPIQNFMLGVSDNALFHLLSDTFEKYGDMPQLEYETPSMEQMTDNAYIQQPVVTTAGKLTGSIAEFAIFSKLIQLIPGVGAAAEKGGQLVGDTIKGLMNKLKIKGAEEAGKLVTTKATEILSDTTVDIALDTVPNLTENIKNGLPVEETLRNAAQSIGTNLGYNLAGTVILHGLNKAVSGAGVKGGTDLVKFNIDEIRPQLKTEPDTAFFWSGKTDGVGGAEVAADIAKGKGGVTLESTIEAKDITMPEWDFNDPSSMDAWDMASAAYAEQVSGEVRAVVGTELRPDNIWENVELPRLMENPNVTKITIIDPKTGIETVIFER